MKVLVTAGGTSEPVDGVRRLTNTSTGATGAVLAETFAAQGAEVLLLHAQDARIGEMTVERQSFVSYSDLEAALRRLLGQRRWDAVVHLAAVSDYHVASLEVDGRQVAADGRGKIGTGREVLIRLAPNPKLIDSLRSWSCNPKIQVVGFKLTNDTDPDSRLEQVEKLRARGVADLVVHNDASEINGSRHVATIYAEEGAVVRTDTKEELAAELYRLLAEGRPS
ncbi:MAG: phosphopantothenoylcysteine decarboxylase [Holophagae bacterium]|jgi:phosphopantothenoylcysteine synthetase/decarboxylase